MTFGPGLCEADRIEAALDELLTAIVEHEEHNPRGQSDAAPGEALSAAIERRINGTAAEIATADILDDPTGCALRAAIAILGERLHEIGGLALMRATCARLEAQDDPRSEIRAGILDHQWDGIGHSDDSPGWFA